MDDVNDDRLDNWVWHALTTEQVTFARRHGAAARYLEDHSVFAAIDDDAGAEGWHDLAELTGDRQGTVLFRDQVVVPDGWQATWTGHARQMVLTSPARLRPATIDGLRPLRPDDVPAMVDLVSRTKPGPFCARTHELGTYLGVFVDGRLVAMAGERSRLKGWTEISAVCTDESYRGRGLAATLVSTLAARILELGSGAFLHVAEDNAPAERVYSQLGFEVRRPVTVAGVIPVDLTPR
jgi:hypothetical protein